jgi:hypothetical protein
MKFITSRSSLHPFGWCAVVLVGCAFSGCATTGLSIKQAEQEQNRWNRIYNACLIDKSDGLDMSVGAVAKAVYGTCEEIADNPSWLQKLWYD